MPTVRKIANTEERTKDEGRRTNDHQHTMNAHIDLRRPGLFAPGSPPTEISLPTGWIRVHLKNLLEVHYGKALKESNRDADGDIPVYGSNGVVGRHSSALTTGSCIVVGRKGAAGAVHLSKGKCWPIDTTYFIQAPQGISLKYLYYALDSLHLGELDKSTAIPGLNRDDLYAQQIPLPPLGEQRRIVEAIETQLTRLDAGVASLRRAQAGLRRYKAAVLKAACEGRLVPQDASDEPADALLRRILDERRAKWEAEQIAKMRAQGRMVLDDGWRAKYQEPQGPNTTSLSELPKGWVWARAEQLCDFITKGTTPSPEKLYSGSGDVPYIKVYNLTDNGLLDFTIKPTFISEETHRGELARSRVLPGDVLMNIVGPPLGKVSMVPDPSRVEYQSGYRNLPPDAQLRPKVPDLLPSYRSYLELGGTTGEGYCRSIQFDLGNLP
jgi:type I restriction enzyme S subunit